MLGLLKTCISGAEPRFHPSGIGVQAVCSVCSPQSITSEENGKSHTQFFELHWRPKWYGLPAHSSICENDPIASGKDLSRLVSVAPPSPCIRANFLCGTLSQTMCVPQLNGGPRELAGEGQKGPDHKLVQKVRGQASDCVELFGRFCGEAPNWGAQCPRRRSGAATKYS